MRVVIKPDRRFSIKRRLVKAIISAISDDKKELTILAASKEYLEVDDILNKSSKTIKLKLTQKKTIYLINDLVIEIVEIDQHL